MHVVTGVLHLTKFPALLVAPTSEAHSQQVTQLNSEQQLGLTKSGAVMA